MAKNGWQKISNTWYYFQSNGTVKTGWLERRQSVVLSEIKRRDGNPDGIMWTLISTISVRIPAEVPPQGSLVQVTNPVWSADHTMRRLDRVRNVVMIYKKKEITRSR